MKFSEFDIEKSILDAITQMGYEKPSEVQERTIPEILKGNNVVVRSYTGSGKTAAFGIPLLSRLIKGESRNVLIIGPTRELVVQVRDELRRIARGNRFKIIAVYGGHGIERETEILRKGVSIVCATPGRLLDHVNRGNINLKKFDTIVLDEADRMLDMGFIEDIKTVLSQASPKNLHLFSATLHPSVKRLVRDYLNSPVSIDIKTEIVGKNIMEKQELVDRKSKFGKLLNYLKNAGRNRVLIFVSTKRFANSLVERLRKRRFRAVAMHGDLSQKKREDALMQFKKGYSNIMVATDVAARGLQIDNVEYVINYDPANDSDTHKHRIGRTGRMGKKGFAINFVETDSKVPRNFENRSIQYHLERGY